MSTSELKPTRRWREIARQVLLEQDHEKALELAEELIRALDAESSQRMDGIDADQKVRSAGRAGTS